jgi:hypothetical protein
MAVATIACPSCGQKLTVGVERAGDAVECPKCRAEFLVFSPPTQTVNSEGHPRDKDDRNKQSKRSGIPVWIWIASGVVIGVLVVGGFAAVITLADADSEVRRVVVVGVPVAILAIAVIIIHNGTAPIYQIAVSGGDICTLKEKSVRVAFDNVGRSVNLRNLKLLGVIITNSSNEPIRVDWDASSFVDPDGQSCRVIHTGVKFTNREKTQVPSTIASRSQLIESIVPVDNIKWITTEGWNYHPLLLPWAGRKRFSFRVVLTMKIRGVEKHYEFRFSATKMKKAWGAITRLIDH